MSVQVNDRKRAEMSAAIAALYRKGWTSVQLATYMQVSKSTIYTWGRGKSMGTNLQRAHLQMMVTIPTADWPRRFRESAETLDRASEREKEAAVRAHASAAHHVGKNREQAAQNYAARAGQLRVMALEFENRTG